MDNVKLVKNGVMRLPPGFRFHPTDEELVVQYLKRKVLSSPLPASIISDFDVCRADPWDLPGWFSHWKFSFLGLEPATLSNSLYVQAVWRKRGTSLAQGKPSTQMGTALIEQPVPVIGKLPVLINGLWPLEEIKSLVWRKHLCSTKANHLMAQEPIGSCMNIV